MRGPASSLGLYVDPPLAVSATRRRRKGWEKIALSPGWLGGSLPRDLYMEEGEFNHRFIHVSREMRTGVGE